MSEAQSELPDWSELEAQFGRAEIRVIDLAVSKFFHDYPGDMNRGDFYLISEGLTHAVLMAMRDRGLRFQSVVQAIR